MESIFTFLNAGALLGWSLILCILLLQSTDLLSTFTTPFFHIDDDPTKRIPLIDLLIFLEVICFIEVGRIAIGQLKGNLVLGVVLHMIRMSCLLLVLPDGLRQADDGFDFSSQYFMSTLVLYSWSLTEVGRYPMYLFANSSKARYVRLVLPIFTFPVGAAAEAIGAYRVLSQLWGKSTDPVYWVQVCSLGMVVLINSLLGPTMAYPALLKKGLPVLMGKGERKKKKS
ncbi:hypothetical protein ACHAXR_013279 [Thalassiosira sp. AJA248-18]